MAGVLRFSALRFIQPTLNKSQKVSQNFVPCVLQVCNISGKSLRGSMKTQKPKPYDYHNKPYNVVHAIFDKTSKRLDENSKVIVVEGPLAAGKTKFAKELAEELEMLYMPGANMDMIYINPYGYDMRQLDPQMPKNCKSYDEKNFCRDPTHRNAATFQIDMYTIRYSQYIDALAHVLSTGQGVVLERSCYSDFVFLEAMFNSKYISKGARSIYYDITKQTLPELLKPHLVIYLDVPVNIVKERLKARNNDYEVNSKALTDKYLNDVESIYKQNYLKDISTHSELLIYDWSNGGDTEVVVEDIERIDFNQFEVDPYNPKMKDWRFPLEWDWCEARITYANDKQDLMNYFNVPRLDVPEILRSPEDSLIYNKVWENAPGMEYTHGYNKNMGDKSLWFKTKLKFRTNPFY